VVIIFILFVMMKYLLRYVILDVWLGYFYRSTTVMIHRIRSFDKTKTNFVQWSSSYLLIRYILTSPLNYWIILSIFSLWRDIKVIYHQDFKLIYYLSGASNWNTEHSYISIIYHLYMLFVVKSCLGRLSKYVCYSFSTTHFSVWFIVCAKYRPLNADDPWHIFLWCKFSINETYFKY